MLSFFNDAHNVEITAFDKQGNMTSVQKTNCFTVLNRISKALTATVMATAAVAGMAQSNQTTTPNLTITNDGSFTASEWKDIRTSTLQATRVPVKTNVNAISMTSTALTSSGGPMTNAYLGTNDKLECKISLNSMHTVGAFVTSAATRSGTLVSPELAKKVIIHHEAAHCMAIASALIENSKSDIFFRYMSIATTNNKELGDKIKILTLEREADASALFTAAKEYMGEATTFAARQAGLTEFNKYAQTLLNLRTTEDGIYHQLNKESAMCILRLEIK